MKSEQFIEVSSRTGRIKYLINPRHIYFIKKEGDGHAEIMVRDAYTVLVRESLEELKDKLQSKEN